MPGPVGFSCDHLASPMGFISYGVLPVVWADTNDRPTINAKASGGTQVRTLSLYGEERLWCAAGSHGSLTRKWAHGRVVVSLDRKCLGAGFRGCWRCSEAFSIRRLEGRRWQWWALLWS